MSHGRTKGDAGAKGEGADHVAGSGARVGEIVIGATFSRALRNMPIRGSQSGGEPAGGSLLGLVSRFLLRVGEGLFSSSSQTACPPLPRRILEDDSVTLSCMASSATKSDQHVANVRLIEVIFVGESGSLRTWRLVGESCSVCNGVSIHD